MNIVVWKTLSVYITVSGFYDAGERCWDAFGGRSSRFPFCDLVFIDLPDVHKELSTGIDRSVSEFAVLWHSRGTWKSQGESEYSEDADELRSVMWISKIVCFGNIWDSDVLL